MKDITISNSIIYIGADDHDLDLFESQYVIPNGISYNSYVILDEKVTVMDTIDARKTEEWLANLETALAGRNVDYLVVQHMEPDHAASIGILMEKYPEMVLVGNAKTFAMIPQFFEVDLTGRMHVVKEGDTLSIGSHTLQFFMAPMVHWPEVMVTYEQTEKILFSADGFGKFGALDTEEDWTCEARRYYFNIVGKYDIWSKYEPEDEGVFIAYASIHGNTAKAAKKFAEMLKDKGAKRVAIADLSRDDMAEAVEDAFRHDKLVLASSTYDGGLFPCMEDFLLHLKAKNYQKRTVALIENGSWAPQAARKMREILEPMKNITILDPVVTIRSAMKAETIEKMEELVENLV